VREFSQVLDDLGSVAGLWRNRLLRVLLVFVLSSLGAASGMWFGLGQLLHSLFS
jgi:pheromone shutdown protein TraB